MLFGVVIVGAACQGGGGPGATGGASPASQPASVSAQPSADLPSAEPTDATATEAPVAVDAGPWIADVCELYVGYFDSDLAIDEEIPIPSGTLEEARTAWVARLDRYAPLNEDWLVDLEQLGPIPGGEPLYEALAAWNGRRIQSTADFRTAIEQAASLEELQAVVTAGGTTDYEDTKPIYISLAELAPDVLSELAAYEGQCNAANVEAAAIPQGRDTADFSQTVLEDDFEGEQVWSTDPMQGHEATQADGVYRITTAEVLPEGGQYWVSSTSVAHDPATFGDVRIEATITRDASMFAGFACRDDGAEDHSAYLMQVAGTLVAVWRKAPAFELVARRTFAELSTTLDLAMECVGGADGTPVTIAVEIDGERVVEWVDENPLAAEGYVGMVAGSRVAGDDVSFEEIRVLIP